MSDAGRFKQNEFVHNNVSVVTPSLKIQLLVLYFCLTVCNKKGYFILTSYCLKEPDIHPEVHSSSFLLLMMMLLMMTNDITRDGSWAAVKYG